MKLSDIVNGPWAITPEMLLEIQSIYAVHLRGDKIDIAKVEAAVGRPLNNVQQGAIVQDGVAIININGPIAKRMNLMSMIFGGVSSQMVARDFLSAISDPNIKGIILPIDSPGGTVDGTSELAEQIFQARGKKPIIAFSDGMVASAAYWIASACDKIFISGDTNPVGSIGVVSAHRDYSGQEAMDGVKTTEITAGAYKRVASQYEPLTDDGRAEIQAKVDYLYSTFVDTVARNRGVSTQNVLSEMANGKIFIGQQALNNRLVDGVSTLSNIITKINKGSIQSKVTGVLPKRETGKMTKIEIMEQFPEAASEIAAEAVANAAICGKAGASAQLSGLVAATMGETIGKKFAALVESGITAEQATALGIKIESEAVAIDEASRAAILDALLQSAPSGVRNSKGENEHGATPTIDSSTVYANRQPK